MENIIDSPDEHINLLVEKGFLSGNFKDGAKVGYWLREFRELYEQAREAGLVGDQPQKFTMSLTGDYNGSLDRVAFLFRYRYTSSNDCLSLFSIHARLGKESKSLYVSKIEDLPQAEEFYKYLRRPWSKENNKTMYIRNYFQYLRDRNPDNDLDEEPPAFKKRPLKFK